MSSTDSPAVTALTVNCVWNLSEADAAASKLVDCSITFRRPNVFVASVSDTLDITGTFAAPDAKDANGEIAGGFTTDTVETLTTADAAEVASGQAFANEFLKTLKSFSITKNGTLLTLVSAKGDKKTFEKELNEY